MFKGWQSDATTDPALLRQYWNGKAGAERNLGLVCGESFDAWDIEVEHVPLLNEWLARDGHVLPESPIASTGRGGIHLLTQPTGVDGTRKLYLDGTHIGELKSTGGFILACPSETVDLYRWMHLPDRLALAPAPDWLRVLLERPAAARRRFETRVASPKDQTAVLGPLAGSVARANHGYRNSYLYWAMRRAIEEGVPVIHARNVLTVAAKEAGLEDREIAQTIESALTAESVAA
jgi:hypothetical protein